MTAAGKPERRRVCLVYQHLAPFVAADRDALASRFDVVPFAYGGKGDLLRLYRTIRRCDLSLSWFALGHATAAVRFSRRSVVVVGGWDVAAMPEIPYGAMLSKSRQRKTIRALRDADVVLAGSEASRRETLRWIDRPVEVVPLGVDADFFSPNGARENLVVTAAGVTHAATVRVKGLDVFLEVARRLPSVAFAIVGRHAPEWDAKLRADAPPNVTVTGWLDREALRDTFRRAKVYAQLSAHESFGLALAEAMACGCAPVASDRGSLPEVVGDAGAVVAYGDAGASAAAVEAALRAGRPSKARERVVANFPLSRRRDRLLEIVEGLP